MVDPRDHCNNGHAFVFVSQSIGLSNLHQHECQNLVQQSMRNTYRYICRFEMHRIFFKLTQKLMENVY